MGTNTLYHHTLYHQRGAALIVSLVFLVILTTLGLSAMEGSNFENKIAQSVKTQTDQFNAAEDQVIAGEKRVKDDFTSNGIGGFNKDFANDTYAKTTIGVIANGIDHAGTLKGIIAGESDTAEQAKKYTIEYLGTITPPGSSVNLGGAGSDKRYLFRVTGYGEGERSGSTITQSYYATTD